MELKTRREILTSLLNDQMEVVVNREASVRMLKKMDPKTVITQKVDMATMQPQTITAESRLKEMEEGLVIDKARLETFQEMLSDESETKTEYAVEKTMEDDGWTPIAIGEACLKPSDTELIVEIGYSKTTGDTKEFASEMRWFEIKDLKQYVEKHSLKTLKEETFAKKFQSA